MLQVSILFEGAEQPVNSVQQAIYVITPRQLDETLIHVTVWSQEVTNRVHFPFSNFAWTH